MGADTQATERKSRTISLEESLPRNQWLKIPLLAMRECRAASQTLAGIIEVVDMSKKNPSTFMSVAKLASSARLYPRTVEKHLDVLAANGWIRNRGREHNGRVRRKRRTCTIELTPKAIDESENAYGALPWWACCLGPKPLPMPFSRRKHWSRPWQRYPHGRDLHLPWCTKAVFAYIMRGLLYCERIAANQGTDLWDVVLNYDTAQYFKLSVARIAEVTGLSERAVKTAKADLRDHRIIELNTMSRDDGGRDTDWLYPNEEFQVEITPGTEEGRCYVAFK